MDRFNDRYVKWVVIEITGLVCVPLWKADTRGCALLGAVTDLAAEAVESAALALESVHDVERGDGLALGVLGVGHGVTDDVLEEDLEDTAGLLVDEAADALDAATASQTADRRLGDALDVVPKDLAVTLGAALAESLASFSTSRHDEIDWLVNGVCTACGSANSKSHSAI